MQKRFYVSLLPTKTPNSIADVWKNVLVNMSDFKELIPEFYDMSNGGDFLVNNYGIDFGYRHDGTKIGDVQLPPWAKGNERYLILILHFLVTSTNRYCSYFSI